MLLHFISVLQHFSTFLHQHIILIQPQGQFQQAKMNQKGKDTKQSQKKQQHIKPDKSQKPKSSQKPQPPEDVRRDQKLQAILLADSFTTTFRPITLESPKVLLPLVNVPMIDYTMEFLTQNGIEEVSIDHSSSCFSSIFNY
jgi:LAS superfamily LD-carboxypeptidase LdcB